MTIGWTPQASHRGSLPAFDSRRAQQQVRSKRYHQVFRDHQLAARCLCSQGVHLSVISSFCPMSALHPRLQISRPVEVTVIPWLPSRFTPLTGKTSEMVTSRRPVLILPPHQAGGQQAKRAFGAPQHSHQGVAKTNGWRPHRDLEVLEVRNLLLSCDVVETSAGTCRSAGSVLGSSRQY